MRPKQARLQTWTKRCDSIFSNADAALLLVDMHEVEFPSLEDMNYCEVTESVAGLTLVIIFHLFLYACMRPQILLRPPNSSQRQLDN